MNRFGLFLVSTLVLLLSVPVTVQADTEAQLEAIDKSIRFREYQKAVKQLQPLLKAKIPQAQFRMAELYRSGRGIKKNLKQALAMYEKAAVNGHVDAQYTLAFLLEKRGDDTQAEYWYQQAAEQGLAKASKKLASLRGDNDSSANDKVDPEKVFSAIRHNDLAQVRALKRRDYNFNILDDLSRTPLMAALLAGHQELAALLVPVTADLDHADKNNNRAIHLATSNNYKKIVRMLLDKKASINVQDGLGNTPLLIAVRHDNAELARVLLQRNANHQLKNKNKKSALELAQTRAHPGVLKVFSSKGIKIAKKQADYTVADINAFRQSIKQSSTLYKGWPILSIASLLGEKEIVKQLIEQGSDINARDTTGHTALHRASSKGQLETVTILITSGASLNLVNKKNESALLLAAQTGRVKTVNFLIRKGADTSIVSSSKTTALSVAISNKHPETAMALVNKKLDRESIHRALNLAVQLKMQNVSLKLIPRDKLINKLDNNKRNLLWHSADSGQLRVVSALLSIRSIKFNQKDLNGYSPLARAVLKGHIKIAQLMLRKKADLNILTKEKNTPLMLAVLSGKKAMLELLIDKAIDVNAKNNAGDTALMLAAGTGNNGMIELLIKSGADIQTRNQDDLNAYQIALNAGKKQSAELIKKNSGKLFKLFN